MSSSGERQRSISSYFSIVEREHSPGPVDLTDGSKNIEPEHERSEPPSKRATMANAHHQASGFDYSWQKKHSWLVHDGTEQGMFCTSCEEFNKIYQEMGVEYG